jgi:hypothetical protein
MVRFVYLLPVETRERKVKPTALLAGGCWLVLAGSF